MEREKREESRETESRTLLGYGPPLVNFFFFFQTSQRIALCHYFLYEEAS